MTTQTFINAASVARHLAVELGVTGAMVRCAAQRVEARAEENDDRYAYWLAVEGEVNYQYIKPQTG